MVDRPLSKIALELPDVFVADINLLVRRPIEERRKEIGDAKNPGKIKRPMNAFMLYRKAYQNLAKRLCAHNNHQLVSQVCGDRWKIEPEDVREQFKEWATIERSNHQEAHPEYKFAPAKPRPKVGESTSTTFASKESTLAAAGSSRVEIETKDEVGAPSEVEGYTEPAIQGMLDDQNSDVANDADLVGSQPVTGEPCTTHLETLANMQRGMQPDMQRKGVRSERQKVLTTFSPTSKIPIVIHNLPISTVPWTLRVWLGLIWESMGTRILAQMLSVRMTTLQAHSTFPVTITKV